MDTTSKNVNTSFSVSCRILTEELLDHTVPMATIHDSFEDAMDVYARYKAKISSKSDKQ